MSQDSFWNRVRRTVRDFATEVVRSCYDLERYRAIRAKPAGAWRYLVSFYVVLGFLVTLLMAPGIFALPGEARRVLDEVLPAGSAVAVKSGQFVTTIPTPKTVRLGQQSLLIDPAHTGSDFPKGLPADTVAVIGRDAIFARGDNEQRTYSLKETPDFRFTQEDLAARIRAYGPWFAALLFIVIFFMYAFAAAVANLAYVAILAALAVLAGKLWRLKLTYRQYFAVGCHAITLPTILDLLFTSFGLRASLVFTFVFVMFLGAVMADERAKPIAA
ncbi:hypothetical protein A3C96_00740 [Candidatus Uhrbacteria bacterium RIFCSPHIGHO2_02_FULL_60_10]|uniref:DUF1189 domain-containing protein n=1 Tax=Candidatus Uhrbacteria bacterium RIFCSPHIGHO2_02_FULL_60_10 TaxID=1802392 RepID=A0A1F7U4S8_9BACT|nr:MAG: hypothetical protein A3C96_00740 [Candidatus Uhrbacteria bacterium RIFCSPHIGHO2_02_FULL_60_10]